MAGVGWGGFADRMFFSPHAPQLKFNLLPCSASEEKACSSRAVLAWLAGGEVHISRVLDLVCGRYLGVVRDSLQKIEQMDGF